MVRYPLQRLSGVSAGEATDFFIPRAARKVAAPVILLIILLIYYAQGPLIFGATAWATLQTAITFYLFLALAALVITPLLVQQEPKYGLVVQFLVYVGIMVGINTLLITSGIRVAYISTNDFWTNILLQVAVAGTEELFFRAALFRFGWLASSALFAGFHFLVYGLNPVLIGLAFVMGIAFYFTYKISKDEVGTSVNAGLHTGYNLALLGVKLLPF